MNNNHSRGIFGKVIAFQSPRAHNCPNCHCHAEVRSPNHVPMQRPASPVFHQNIKPTQMSYPNQFDNKPIVVSTNVVRQRVMKRNPMPENIYFKRTDRCDSQNSLSNRSISSRASNEGKIIQVISSPRKGPQINIRYVSPPKQNNNQAAGHQNKIGTQRSINAFNNTSILRQFQKSLYHTKTNQNFISIQKYNQISNSQMQPRVPSILKKRSSQNKKQRQQSPCPQLQIINQVRPSQFAQYYLTNRQIIEQNRQADLGTVSAIYSRNVIQKRTSSQSFVVKGQWQPSAYDVLIEQEQEKALAQQISKDLKLNYDYYETRDISDLSANAN